MTPARSLLLLFTLLFSVHNEILNPAKAYPFREYMPLLKARDTQHFEKIELVVTIDEEQRPVRNEEDVVVLSDGNLTQFVTEDRYVLVNFHAPWCHWSQQLAPEYAAAASLLKGEEPVLAKFDASEPGMAKKYGIQGYPTMYFYVKGIRKEAYYSERTSEAIASWVKQQSTPRILTINAVEEAVFLMASMPITVWGIFDALEGQELEEFSVASLLQPKVHFYQTTGTEVAKILGGIGPDIKRPALVVFKREAKRLISFDGPFTTLAISHFVLFSKYPFVTEVTIDNAWEIQNEPVTKLFLFAYSNCSKETSAFREAAKAFEGKVLFAHVEMDNENLMWHLPFSFDFKVDSPRVIGIASHGARKYEMKGEITCCSIKSFVEDFLKREQLSQSGFNLKATS